MKTDALIYKAFWQFLHIICSIYDVLFGFYQLSRNVYIEIKSSFNVKLSDVEYINLNVKNMTKIPNHMTVLLGTEDLSYSDIAKIIKWSLAAGINYVSFYDITGVIKENISELQRQTELLHLTDCHVIWHVGSSTTGGTNGMKDGGSKVHVKALSAADGRESIARVTRTLADTQSSAAITVDAVNEELRKEYEFPDPDLALYCTEVFTVGGYPPWQIRLTEFVQLGHNGAHKHASHITFVDSLYKFSKCEQRKGK